MKYILVIIFFLVSFSSFSQPFGLKEKEQLIYGSLKSCGFVNSKSDLFRTIYVIVDTHDSYTENFIRCHFPDHQWFFFDSASCQQYFRGVGKDSLVSAFRLSSWEKNNSYYFDLAFGVLSRTWKPDYGSSNDDLVFSIFCGDAPTGRLKFDHTKEQWIFQSQEDIENEHPGKVKAQGRNRSRPRGDSGLYVLPPAINL
jgi:hypothetical protein